MRLAIVLRIGDSLSGSSGRDKKGRWSPDTVVLPAAAAPPELRAASTSVLTIRPWGPLPLT